MGELLLLAVRVTEYQMAVRRGAHWGRRTRLVCGPACHGGPSGPARSRWWFCYRDGTGSRREVQRAVQDMWGVGLSLGGVMRQAWARQQETASGAADGARARTAHQRLGGRLRCSVDQPIQPLPYGWLTVQVDSPPSPVHRSRARSNEEAEPRHYEQRNPDHRESLHHRQERTDDPQAHADQSQLPRRSGSQRGNPLPQRGVRAAGKPISRSSVAPRLWIAAWP